MYDCILYFYTCIVYMLIGLLFIISILLICGLIIYILIHKNNIDSQIYRDFINLIQIDTDIQFEKSLPNLKNASIDDIININLLYSPIQNKEKLYDFCKTQLLKKFNISTNNTHNKQLYLYYIYLIVKKIKHINQYIEHKQLTQTTTHNIDKFENETNSECNTKQYYASYIETLNIFWKDLAIILKILKTIEYPQNIKTELKTQFHKLFVKIKNYQTELMGIFYYEDNLPNTNMDIPYSINDNLCYYFGFQKVMRTDKTEIPISNLCINDKIISFGGKISTVKNIHTIDIEQFNQHNSMFYINEHLIVTQFQPIFTVNGGWKSVQKYSISDGCGNFYIIDNLKVGDKILCTSNSINTISTYTPEIITSITNVKINQNVVDHLYFFELDNSYSPIIANYPLANPHLAMLFCLPKSEHSQSKLNMQTNMNFVSYIEMHEIFNKIFSKTFNQKIMDHISQRTVLQNPLDDSTYDVVV